MKRLHAVVLGAAIVLAPSYVLADPPGSHGKPASPPLGFMMFCLKFPAECRPRLPVTIDYTWRVYFDISRVNRDVNRQIKPKHDVRDSWNPDVKSGDCDDYVMTKRRRLMNMGYPTSALRMAVVITRSNEMHLVLVVETPTKRLVLNNLTPTIKELKDTSYTLVMMSTADPNKWVF